MLRTASLAATFLIISVAGAAAADALDRIRQSGEIRFGYRTDTVPFAFEGADGQPTGYSVALCRSVAENLGVRAKWVAVGAGDRFELLQNGTIDLLCGATSATLSRRETVDFSIATFIDGGSVLLPTEGPARFNELAGKTIGVRANTTTEAALREKLQADEIVAAVLPVSKHDEGVAKVASGEIAAYFADQSILLYLKARSDTPLRLSEEVFTLEPYALALPHGSSGLRLAVDRTLSQLYRSGKIAQIFTEAFGETAKPGPVLQALYTISPLPE